MADPGPERAQQPSPSSGYALTLADLLMLIGSAVLFAFSLVPAWVSVSEDCTGLLATGCSSQSRLTMYNIEGWIAFVAMLGLLASWVFFRVWRRAPRALAVDPVLEAAAYINFAAFEVISLLFFAGSVHDTSGAVSAGAGWAWALGLVGSLITLAGAVAALFVPRVVLTLAPRVVSVPGLRPQTPERGAASWPPPTAPAPAGSAVPRPLPPAAAHPPPQPYEPPPGASPPASSIPGVAPMPPAPRPEGASPASAEPQLASSPPARPAGEAGSPGVERPPEAAAPPGETDQPGPATTAGG